MLHRCSLAWIFLRESLRKWRRSTPAPPAESQA
jgi:hypothetical protein